MFRVQGTPWGLEQEEIREWERTDGQYFENWIQQWAAVRQIINRYQSKCHRLWYWSDNDRSSEESIQTNQRDKSYCCFSVPTCTWLELPPVLGHLLCTHLEIMEREMLLHSCRLKLKLLSSWQTWQTLTMNNHHLIWIALGNAVV